MTEQTTAAPLLNRFFTIKSNHDMKGYDPFRAINWVKRDAKIGDASGEVFFEQKDVEFPDFWSQQAVNIVASKYFKGPMGTGRRETSVKQLIKRVVNEIRDVGYNAGYFDNAEQCNVFADELKYVLVNQMASFNSPVWFNVGVADESSSGWCWYGRTTGSPQLGTALGPRPVRDDEHKPQTSACFIVAPEDNMDSILGWVKTEGKIFKGGSGAGANVSKLRSEKETLGSGGRPSGPLSFMQICDKAAGSIKSGGKHRRAAKMIELDTDHPDIFKFVESKAREERKIRKLIDAGFANDFNNPEGAQAAAEYQNENHSVSADDTFMEAVVNDRSYSTIARTTGKVVDTFKARHLMRAIAEATHACGDPGMQFRTTMNKMHVAAGTAPIRGTNPCSEYVFIDDSSCNLASLNLMKFISPDGSFDVTSFQHAVAIMIVAQEILVDLGSYPTAEICKNSHNLRPLGLGYCNLGAYLMSLGYAYDSDVARSLAGEITAIMTGQAYLTSMQLAKKMGPFPAFGENTESISHVLFTHSNNTVTKLKLSPLQKIAENLWRQVYQEAVLDGNWIRNAQVTVLAPTGTIGFMMDCDTTGIEPEYNLVKYKQLVGGGTMKIVNQTIEKTLDKLGYTSEIPFILKHIEENNTVEGARYLHPKYYDIFDTAGAAGPYKRSIHYMGHVKMMAAVQPFLSGAISKTVNLPETATVEDIENAYLEAWKLGLKAIAIYRDGSKNFQPMAAKDTKKEAPVQFGRDVLVSWGPEATMGCAIDFYRNHGLPEKAAKLAEYAEKNRLPITTLMKAYWATRDLSDGFPDPQWLGSKVVSQWIDAYPEIAQLVQKKADAMPSKVATQDQVKDVYSEGLAVGLEMGKKMPTRRKMPDTRSSICHKFDIAGHQGYLHVGLYPDGKPGEIFITMNKEGSTLAGLLGNFSLVTSIALQYGVPLERLVAKLKHVKYEPSGITKHPDIHFADSVIDYIFRWLELEFLTPKLPLENFTKQQEAAGKAMNGILQAQIADIEAAGGKVVGQIHDELIVEAATAKQDSSDAPFCNECGSLMIRNGSCFKCGNCGGTSGCS